MRELAREDMLARFAWGTTWESVHPIYWLLVFFRETQVSCKQKEIHLVVQAQPACTKHGTEKSGQQAAGSRLRNCLIKNTLDKKFYYRSA